MTLNRIYFHGMEHTLGEYNASNLRMCFEVLKFHATFASYKLNDRIATDISSRSSSYHILILKYERYSARTGTGTSRQIAQLIHLVY